MRATGSGLRRRARGARAFWPGLFTVLTALAAAVSMLAGGGAASADPAPEAGDEDGGSCVTVTYTPEGVDPQVGDLCRPGKQRDTLVVLIHGGGGVQGSRTSMTAWAQRLGKAGYPTLAIDYTLFDPDTAEPPVFPRPERDVKTAIQWVRMQADDLDVDPDKVVLLGTSAGARLAGLMFVTADTPDFPTQGDWPGVSTRVGGLIGFYGGYNGGMLNAEAYYGGGRDSDDPAVRERWSQANAVAQAERAGGPALLFHGDADETAPVEQSRRFGRALTDAGKDAKVVIVPGVGHSFDRAKTPGRPLTAEGEQAADMILEWLPNLPG